MHLDGAYFCLLQSYVPGKVLEYMYRTSVNSVFLLHFTRYASGKMHMKRRIHRFLMTCNRLNVDLSLALQFLNILLQFIRIRGNRGITVYIFAYTVTLQ